MRYIRELVRAQASSIAESVWLVACVALTLVLRRFGCEAFRATDPAIAPESEKDESVIDGPANATIVNPTPGA